MMQIQAMKLQSIFVLLIMAINVVNCLDPAYVKSEQIAKKDLKIIFFCSIKNRTPTVDQSFAVYEFVCSGCSASYAEKTERNYKEIYME